MKEIIGLIGLTLTLLGASIVGWNSENLLPALGVGLIIIGAFLMS